MEYIEFKGATKNDAITAACTHFSIPSSKLDYEVIEEGKAGFLGIGSKPAVIKARIKEESEIVEEKSESVNIITEDPVIASVKEAAEKIEDIDVEAIAKKFLEDVFKAMNLTVNMDIKYNDSLRNLDVELSGDEMGVLIGKRGQTLDSLQYLISLVVNKGTNEYVRVKVDTENYRERRKETLENLAKNISYKVKRTRRSVSLEPMNPYERRIIHSALQNDKYVTTHSEGEEPFRRVVVVPKRDANYSERGGYSRGGYGSGRGGYSKGGYNRGYNKNYKNANAENANTENTETVGNNDNSSETEE
ncbi:MAG: protein jag [Lachnospiraceae bacterium]|nr:protein jag [Lachnospiraceae bacterium]